MRILLLATIALVMCCPSCAHKAAYPSATPQRVAAVTEEVFPAVVRLDVKQETYSEGKRRLEAGIGSGVIIDAEGRVLTNYHVAGRAAEIYITLFNRERIPAKLIGDDHWTDLAVVQMDMKTIKEKHITFAHAQLGTSRNLVPGQDVIAIGTPFGLARTLTLGVVSNPDQVIGGRTNIGEYETGDFANWIQMDTPINPGNSGGPLVDLEGRIVGINTRGGGQNLNFAIPIDLAREVVQKILSTAEDNKLGRVDRSDLGLNLKPLQGLESFYNLDINKGVLIESVERGSPAASAGVASQDILMALDGKPTNARFPEELAPLRKRIGDLPIGSNVSLSVKRGDQTLVLSMKTDRLESAVGIEREFKIWGLTVRDITRAYANSRQLDDHKGVAITSLNRGYAAAKAELRMDDVIVRVNEKPVEDIQDFIKLYDESVARKDATVLVDLRRRRSTQQAILKISYDN